MMKTASFLRILMAAVLMGGLGAVFAAPLATQAAVTQGYQISPPVNTLAMDRGTSSRQVIKVTNLTDQQLTLVLAKRNFVAKGEEGEVELIDDANPLYSLAPYFTLSQPTVTVAPKSTAEVSYVISVPANAEPGGRYGSVTFNTIAAKLPQGQSGASIRQELAALIFLRINGEAHEQLAIESFKTDKGFYEYGPVNFATRIKNLGNVHAKPTGEIVVKNWIGWTTAKLKIDEKQVLPAAIRRLDSQIKNKWLLGPYTATLTLKNGELQTLTAKTTFTALPYKVVAVILLVLLVLIYFIRKTRRRWARAFRILAGRE